MIYPQNFEFKIGFDRIRAEVAAMCTTTAGKNKLDAQTFSYHISEIVPRLDLCNELRTILMMETGFPTGDYIDTDQLMGKAAVEGTFLETTDLMLLRSALTIINNLLTFFKDKQGKYPLLTSLVVNINGYSNILNHIDSIIDRFGNIKDNASAELYSITRAIREREGQAAKRLQQVLARAQKEGLVDADASLSIRDGRTVIPVSASNKRKISGFIHDESATGKTVYIEPVEVVEINNELKELEYAQRREIVRILTEFTAMLRPDIEGVAAAGDMLTTMDMLRAKARYAVQASCVKPIISTDGRLDLRRACHPLLAQNLAREGKKIVPLDLQLTSDKHILLISGPNAGGKSVCLKTVGLLQYMLQCGFLVPAAENSEMPLFRSLFIDIGDQQSIDNDLSTYSSHLINMKNMVANASSDSLVLIDEFGTGTEPTIGGAIAESILERFEQRGCYAVITTHYANLKYYASNAAGVVNGGMMFDVQNIEPLFVLEMGTPGSSFAVEIARKIGLPEDIIRSASIKAGSDHMNVEKLLREAARDKRYWEQKRDRIRIAERKVEELEQKYASELLKIKQERAEIIKQARAEAEKLTLEANKQIENTIRTIKESNADREKTRTVRRELDQFKQTIQSSDHEQSSADIERRMEKLIERQQRRSERKEREGIATEPTKPEPAKKVIEQGSKVRISGQQSVGEVVSTKGKKATVAFGQIMTTIELERLEWISNTEYKRNTRPTKSTINLSTDVSERKLNFKHNIDVRGMRAAQALEHVEDFMDDASMLGVSEVTILHGKGTGALKEEIRRYLRSLSTVESAADEHVERGGAGITVVRLKA